MDIMRYLKLVILEWFKVFINWVIVHLNYINYLFIIYAF